MINGDNIRKKRKDVDSDIHIGQLIKEECRKQHISATELAEALSYERANVYKLFEKPLINIDTLFKISKILNYDFFALYSKQLDINLDKNRVHVLIDVYIPAKKLQDNVGDICDYCTLNKITKI
jgi:plasmid maintenance system antidote protein VapI